MRQLVVAALLLVALACASGYSDNYPKLPQTGKNVYQSRIAIYLEVDLLSDTDVGVIYLNLAEHLIKAGHSVTIITDVAIPSETEYVVTPYRNAGIQFHVLERMDLSPEFTPEHAWTVYHVYEYLKTQAFDIVHFPDWKGNAYYSVLAKRQGIAFENTIFVVGAQAPYIWSKLSNFERVHDTKPMEIDFMQRKSVELADIVVSPSQFMMNWMNEQSWKLPEQSYVQPNLISPRIPRKSAITKLYPKEIVFYGNLSPSQGLVLFCDALDRLNSEADLPSDLRVTFLGVAGDVQGISSVDYIAIRGKRWTGFQYHVISNKDRYEALRYLMASSRLAVIAPEKANSPLRVQELMEAGLPFLASDVGGISELISKDSSDVLFPAQSNKLAAKLISVVRSGITPASPSFSPRENVEAWTNFHAHLRAESVSEVPVSPSALPLATVLIIHHDRPEYLLQAVESVENQDYPNLEVVLVDDASTTPEGIAAVNSLRDRFAAKGWKIVSLEENSYLGKARNIGVKNASGKYVIFLDDDNVAKPWEVSTFVKVAEKTGADVLTSAEDYFYGGVVPAPNDKPYARRVPIGGDIATGFFWNCFGDANSFVRRESFLRVGGFTEDYRVGYEDYEFFAKAVLKGLDLQVIPEPLFWYRRVPGSMSSATSLYQNRMRYIRPYMETLPPEISNLFLYVQSLYYNGRDEAPYTPGVQFNQDDQCSSAWNCSDCTLMAGCGWCASTNSCMAGSSFESADGTCNITNGWQTEKSQCVDCAAIKSCDKCGINGTYCGWCESSKTCVAGDSRGPFVGMCPAHSKWTFLAKSCPSESDDDDKKRLAIIIACVVVGSLLAVVVVATIIFLVYRQNQMRRGYIAINQG